jgi:hypothetical protein
MNRPASQLPRDSQGRFLKRGIRARKDPIRGEHEVHEGRNAQTVESRNIGGLAVLTLAMIAGVFGFVFHPFWVVALVLMAVLWGSIATLRHTHGTGKGIVAETVTAAVDQAKEIADSASGSGTEDR